MKASQNPRLLLTATCVDNRNRGRLFLTIRDSFVDGLKLLVNDMDELSDLKDWHEFARNKCEWGG